MHVFVILSCSCTSWQKIRKNRNASFKFNLHYRNFVFWYQFSSKKMFTVSWYVSNKKTIIKCEGLYFVWARVLSSGVYNVKQYDSRHYKVATKEKTCYLLCLKSLNLFLYNVNTSTAALWSFFIKNKLLSVQNIPDILDWRINTYFKLW